MPRYGVEQIYDRLRERLEKEKGKPAKPSAEYLRGWADAAAAVKQVTKWAVPPGYASHIPHDEHVLAAIPMLREDDVLDALSRKG